MVVEVLETNKELGIKKDEKYNAIMYELDPLMKVTLLSRVKDGYRPECNEYRYNVKIIEN